MYTAGHTFLPGVGGQAARFPGEPPEVWFQTQPAPAHPPANINYTEIYYPTQVRLEILFFSLHLIFKRKTSSSITNFVYYNVITDSILWSAEEF